MQHFHGLLVRTPLIPFIYLQCFGHMGPSSGMFSDSCKLLHCIQYLLACKNCNSESFAF
jgi:hypothetical protein